MASSTTYLSVILYLSFWAAIGAAESLKYRDPKQPIGVRIKDLMKRMTLAEKIGQMTQIERKVASPQVMKDYFIGKTQEYLYCLSLNSLSWRIMTAELKFSSGSVLSGGGSVPAPQASAEAWVSMVNDIQNGALSTRLGIPMLYGIDAIHGHNNVYNATIFPHNIGLGATRQVFLNFLLNIWEIYIHCLI